jgi:hypothetical protein
MTGGVQIKNNFSFETGLNVLHVSVSFALRAFQGMHYIISSI